MCVCSVLSCQICVVKYKLQLYRKAYDVFLFALVSVCTNLFLHCYFIICCKIYESNKIYYTVGFI